MKKYSIIVLLACSLLLTACGKLNVSYEKPKWIDSIKSFIGIDKPEDNLSLDIPEVQVTMPDIELPTEPLTEAPTEPLTEPTVEAPTEPTEPTFETIYYEPYTDWRGISYEIVEPYPIPIANPDKEIYDSPDGRYVGTFGTYGYYTIVEQAKDTDGYTWGKLSTGEGWTLVYSQILPELTMTYSSGVGAWSTTLNIRGNGFFSGSYSDSNLGETGSGYPNGTVYVSDFDGKFNVTDIGKYSIALKLSSVDTDDNPGKSWISNGTKYIATDPFGLENTGYFILYLPGTTDNMLPDAVAEAERGIYNGVLSCYILYNPSTGAAFYSY